MNAMQWARGRGLGSALGLVVALWALCASAQAAERVALVVGNSKYHDPNAVLVNPGNDADGMAAALGRLGFEVVLGKDLDTDRFDEKIDEFEKVARGADVTLLFYAGHGLQVDGKNWLMPVNAKLERRRDLDRRAVALDAVMKKMGGTKKLVFLDACRNNPLARGLARSMGLSRTEATSRGLARVKGVPGTLVVYATEAGDVASDGDGDNSPFTEALLAHIERPGLNVFAMIDAVAQSVFKATNEKQLPSIQSSPMGLGSFSLASAAVAPPPPPPPGGAKEAYEAAERVGTVAAYRAFIRRFPGSFEAELAQAWIDKHEKPVAAPEELERRLELDREEYRWVQKGLAAAGHDPGPADGRVGRGTREAIRRWQESRGEPVTGYLDVDGAKALMGLGREHEAAPLRRFTELLGRPFSPRWKDVSVDWTDLHYAALLDLPEVVAALCDAGMDADTRLKSGSLPFGDDLKRTLAALGHEGFKDWNADGETPLMIASVGNARNAAAALAACGADVNAKGDTGDTPLHFAALRNALDVAKLLFERGADVNAKEDTGWTPLHFAALRNDLDVAKLLIERGADVKAAALNGTTPLHFAANRSFYDMAKLLIDRGAAVNAKDEDGKTPLLISYDLDLMKLLIDRGADVNASSNYGSTRLGNAFLNINPDVAKLLIDRGANGWTPLFLAVIENRLDVAKRLIDLGADVNAKGASGWTPLHLAGQLNSLDMAKLLIDHGADVNEKRNLGWTPLLWAAGNENSLDMAKLLIDHGADVNAKNKWGYTPLHSAASGNSLDMAKLLIKHGADVNATDNDGNTPLDHALSGGHPDMQALLRESGGVCKKEC